MPYFLLFALIFYHFSLICQGEDFLFIIFERPRAFDLSTFLENYDPVFLQILPLLHSLFSLSWSNMNKKDKYFWRIQNWKWVFSGLYFARPLTYQPIKNTKVEKNYIKLVFSIFSLGIERTKHQKSWSFTKAG